MHVPGSDIEPMVEGILYPSDAHELQRELKSFLASTAQQTSIVHGEGQARNISAVIVSPHGSYEYCGHVMGASFGSVSGTNFTRIIIVASCYQEQRNMVYLPESKRFRTPLGYSAVDEEFIQTMVDSSTLTECNDLPHLQEHAIELQLPFIQLLWPQARIVPILLGASSEIVLRAAIGGITMALSGQNEATLLVVSANLTGVVEPEGGEIQAAEFLDLLLKGNQGAFIENLAGLAIRNRNAGPLALGAFFAGEHPMRLIARDKVVSVHYGVKKVVEYAALRA